MASRDPRKDLLAVFILIGFCFYLFRDILFGGHFLFGLDFNSFYLGMRQFLYDEVHGHGSIPYWNPYILGGIPFWAHFESGIFYPLGFLFWILPAGEAYGYTVFLHLMFAALFMYGLARSFGINRPGSFLSATVFACSGFFMALVYLGQLGPIQSYVWLPGVIYFLNRSLRGPNPYRNGVFAGLVWGVQILAGAPQDAFYTFLASVLFLLFGLGKDGSSPAKSLFQPVKTGVFLFITGAGIAAIQIVPAFEFVNESVRSTLDSYVHVTLGSYPPEGFITAFLPRFFGDYTQNESWVGNIPYSVPQQNLYLGFVPLIMITFITWRRHAQTRILFFLLVIAVLALVLAMGRHTPLYNLAYHLPGFDRFRSPFRILVLWVFAGSLLAGMGMSDFMTRWKSYSAKRFAPLFASLLFIVILDLSIRWNPEWVLKLFSPFFPPESIPGRMDYAVEIIGREFHRFTLLASVAFLIVLLIVRRTVPGGLGTSALCALLLVDLAVAHGPSVKHDDGFYERTESIRRSLAQTIGDDRTVFRVGSFRSTLSPNTEMFLGYQTVGGFTALFLHRFYEYINHYSEGSLPEGWQYFCYGRHPREVFMDICNVKYEISHASRQCALRDRFLPRAFVVPHATSMRQKEVLPFMTSGSFDPKKTVVFEEPFEPEPFPVSPEGGSASQIISYRPDEIRVRVSSPSPAYLFLSEVYYPGWKGFVDEQPVPILRGNYLFRVIRIPAGNHVVRVVFEPLSIRIGITITLLSVFGLTVLAVACLVHNKRQKRYILS
jgi:hypothetical protein